jgi:hypothetical protein
MTRKITLAIIATVILKSLVVTLALNPFGTPSGPDGSLRQPAAASSGAVRFYAFVNSQDLAGTLPAASVAIVKGRLDGQELISARGTAAVDSIVNYEQAAALNSSEASLANSKGYLARTCSGALIHPRSIPSVTLMDLTNPEAVAWRAAMVSSETAVGYDQTYLDTLGSFYPDKFYTGRPCRNGVAITNAQWRDGSISLLTSVRNLTAKPVIANGFGLGSGGGYLRHQADSDLLIAAADGVQIEQFTRSGNLDRDAAYLRILAAKGKTAYAKCKSTLAICEATFLAGAGPDAYLAVP